MKEVIELLEQELKSSNQLTDSLQTQNERFEPFKGLIEENALYVHQLKTLKNKWKKIISYMKNQLLMTLLIF